MGEWQDKPFGGLLRQATKVLVWIPWTGYAMSHIIEAGHTVGQPSIKPRTDEIGFPYQILISGGGPCEMGEPDPDVCEFVKKWNQEYEGRASPFPQPAMRLRH